MPANINYMVSGLKPQQATRVFQILNGFKRADITQMRSKPQELALFPPTIQGNWIALATILTLQCKIEVCKSSHEQVFYVTC